MKTNLLNSSESEVRNNSILYGVTEGAASSVVSAVSVPYVSRKSLVSRLMRTAAVVMLLMTVGVGDMWGYTLYLYTGYFSSWNDGSAAFQVYTNSNENFTSLGNNWYSVDVGTFSGTAYVKRYNSDYSEKWNEFSVSISSTNNVVRATDWNAGGAFSMYITGDNWNSIGSWATNNANGKMTISSGTEFSKTFTNVVASAHQFKIVEMGTWDRAIGYSSSHTCTNGTITDNSGNIQFTPYINTGTTTIKYNVSTGKVTITCPQIPITLSKNGGAADGSAKADVGSSTLSDYTGVTRTDWNLTGYWTATSGGYQVMNNDGTLVSYNSNISAYLNTNGTWKKTSATTLYAQWSQDPSIGSLTEANSTSKVWIGENPTGALTFTATSSNVSSGASVSWSISDASSGTFTQTASSYSGATWTYTPASTGSKTITVTMSVGGTDYTKTYNLTVYERWNIYVQNNCNWANGVNYYTYGNGENAAWPGVCGTDTGCEVYQGTWYKVTLDSYYTNFILNNGNAGEQSENLSMSKSTYTAGTFWYFNYHEQRDGKKYYYLTNNTSLAAPTVTLDTGDDASYMVNTNQIFVTGHITNYGGDGSAAKDMLEVGFKIGDTEYPMTCKEGDNAAYFWGYITGLTADTSYTVKAYAKNIAGTGVSSNSKSITTRSTGTTTIKVRSALARTAPKIYAWTGEASCNGTKQENATAPGTTMTLAATGTVYKWYTYDLPNTYNKFYISEGTSATQTDNFDNPFEETCYWYAPTENNTDGHKRMGTMICPSFEPQLMIDDGQNGSFKFEDMSLTTGTAAKSMTLTGGKTYRFKIIYQGEYFSKNSTSLSCATREVAALNASDEDNLTLRVDFTGTYTFNFNTTSKKLEITFPTINKLLFYDGEGNLTNDYDFGTPTSNTYSKTIENMTANTTYQFMVVYNCNFYCFKTGSPAARANNPSNPVTAYNCDNPWSMYANESGTQNCYMTTTLAGDYTFSFNSNTSKLTIQYPQNIILSCNKNSWTTTTNMTAVAGSSTKYYYDISLDADADEEFKVVYNSAWYGASGANEYITSSDAGTAKTLTANGNNYHLAATMGTTYRFTFDKNDKTITVTYPSPVVTAMTGTVALTATNAVKGTGTSADPYIVFENSSLILSTTHTSAPTANAHFKYDYYNGAKDAATATSLLTTKLSTASDARTYTITNVGTTLGKYPLKVSAYWEYGPTGYKVKGTANESSIYYQVIAKPTVTLTAPSMVQTGSDLTLTTTYTKVVDAGKQTGELKYTYEYCAATTAANPNSTYGSWTEFNAISTNATVSKPVGTTPSWYKFRVKMTYGGQQFTSNEVKVVNYTPYIITIKENETTQGWFKMIYAWNNYDNTYQNENYPGEMKDTITSIVDAKTWLYEFKYPYYTKMIINGKDMETNKSDDLEITGHTCLTITGNKEGVANWAVTKEDNCSNTFYRVKTTIGSKTYYSNMVENATDWVSFYANLTDAAKIYIQTSDGATITDMDVTSTYKSQMRTLTNGDPQNHSYDGTTYPGNVFKAKIASNSTLSNLELYKGNYYISCESSAGGTINYINEGNKFNRFVPDRTSVNEWYNHYYCQWIIAEKPVVATVGNEYNRSLSVILGADRFCPGGVVPNITNEYHDVNGVLTAYEGNGLNIRFAYDNYSNRFERAALMGSTANVGNNVNYLQAYGDYLYKGKTGNEVYSSENGMAVFTDISNYTYQVELYADNTSTIVLEAPIHFYHDGSNLIQYLLGVDAEDTPLRPALLDGNSNDRWHMRIIYDYKINRIITAWLVDDTENISDNKVLDANMMVTRYADTKSSVISVNTGKSVSAVHKVITVLEFTLDDVRSVGIESGDYVEASFWICLPYDCMVSDVFGIGNYNPDYAALDGNIRKWQICRYAGEKRAQNGWYKPTTTFWYKQDQDGVDYMHAYQGYAVNLKLHTTNDFKVVQVQKKDANGDPMFDGDKPILEDKTLVRIYFPSKDTGEDFTVENETDMQVTLDPYICDKQTATEDRRLKDSNWHLIGNPTYAQARVTTSSVRSDYDWNTYSMSTTVANYTFLYRYDFKKRGDSSRSYVAFDATSQDMYPTFAYMAQWAGVMHWTANSASLKSSNIRRRMATNDEQLRRQVRLELRQTKEDNEEFADQTYINLTDDATEGFDLNLDLEKLNNGNGDLYSLSSVQDDPIQQLAANSMPVQDRTVMLGVNIAENGTYTISMPDETEGLVATLYDSETKQEYNLASESCRVELAKGKYENRFMLILKVTDGSQTTTSTSDAEHQITIAQRDGEFVINGIDEPTQVTLYDAVGKQIYHGKIMSGSVISTPQSGVYLLHIGSEVYRIMRK
ncbi:MAG: hypothetical protein IJ834_00270 [Paludibacteraceae bacterium]|nr:hypothetical protein [Paludibacteraceae bacterium]